MHFGKHRKVSCELFSSNKYHSFKRFSMNASFSSLHNFGELLFNHQFQFIFIIFLFFWVLFHIKNFIPVGALKVLKKIHGELRSLLWWLMISIFNTNVWEQSNMVYLFSVKSLWKLSLSKRGSLPSNLRNQRLQVQLFLSALKTFLEWRVNNCISPLCNKVNC